MCTAQGRAVEWPAYQHRFRNQMACVKIKLCLLLAVLPERHCVASVSLPINWVDTIPTLGGYKSVSYVIIILLQFEMEFQVL